VQGVTFLQKAETVPYEFWSELYGTENEFYDGAPHSTSGKRDAINRGARLPKATPGEEIESKKLRSPEKAFKVRFLGTKQYGYRLKP